MNRFTSLCVGIALSCAGATQAATLYDFSYQTTTQLLAGQLSGTLQADDNTIVVDSIVGTPTMDGIPVLPLTHVQSILDLLGAAPGNLPVVSLDGSLMDIAACTDSNCDEGFAIDSEGGAVGFPLFYSEPAYGSHQEFYEASAWSIAAAPVPEPETWALVALGLLGVAARGRKRAA